MENIASFATGPLVALVVRIVNVPKSKITNCYHVRLVTSSRKPNQNVFMNSGGGIGGLTLSAALRFLGNEHNLEIHIYEAASNIAEIGVGINVWPRSWHIMEKIGLKDKLLDLLFETPDDSMRGLSLIFRNDRQ